MNHFKPSKIKGVINILLVGYFFGVAGAGPLAWKMYLDNRSGSTPEWFFFCFAFGLPIFTGIAMLLVFLTESRHRKQDPYRFSRLQYRFIETDVEPTRDLPEFLSKLGCGIVVDIFDTDKVEIEVVRGQFSDPSRFREIKNPTPHKIIIKGKRHDSRWRLIVSGEPMNSLAIADFRSTVFDSLEELVDKCGWRKQLRKWDWTPLEAP